MSEYQFHEKCTLAEVTDKLGKKALQLGLILSFVVRYYPDCRQYYIPNEVDSEAFTLEQAYMRLKELLQQANFNGN